MEKKLYIFKNPNWATTKKVFTHYWTNEGENYWDTVSQGNDGKGHTTETEYTGNPTEEYLQQFKDEGYSWVSLDSTRYQHDVITEITVQMNERDWDENPTLFFKVVNEEYGLETDIPLYYYSYTITESSDQNYPTTSYTVKCKLDMWATYWCRMHSIMKGCTEDVDFIQKMCDRFIFNEQFDDETGERIDSQGFIIDYLKQPYLMRSNKYPQNLVVNDDRENFLTLEEWLFINSGKQDAESYETWLKDTWMKWLQKPYVGVFSPSSPISAGANSFYNAEDLGKIQNKWAEQLTNSFYDTDFNSNTKYRYLVCKVGNNTPPSSLIEGKPQGMFTNFKFDTVLQIPSQKVHIDGLGQGKWEEYEPYAYKATKSITGLSGLSEGAVCIYWDNWLVQGRHMTFRFDPYLINEGGMIQYPSDYVTWTDGFQQKTYRKVLNGFVYGKEYTLFELPTKSYAFDIYGDYVNVNLEIRIRFNNASSADLIFYVWFDKGYQQTFAEKYLKIDTYLEENVPTNEFYISQSGQSATAPAGWVNGETLMLIPFKKGTNELKYIQYLNSTDKGILMGDGSVLGMPINDIPPSVLALAIRRQNDEAEYQTIGDMLSIRHADTVSCPLDLVDFKLGDLQMPTIFTGFESVPVVVARAPLRENIYQCVGGNKFFNYFFDILTNKYLTNNWETYDLKGQTWIKHGGNCIEAEPFLYGPQFWKWSYFIDGNHILELTADKIDFLKLMLDDDWEVKLNTSFNSTTNYFLDISEIKNNKFPMSKLGMEYVTSDPGSFPFTTEAYNNWLQNNQLTQETSKNANEIQNRYARTGAIISGTTEAVATAATLTAQAAAGGGFISKGIAVGVGASMGAIAGGAKAAGIIAGAENAIAQANEEWQNKWNAELGNRYSAPSQLNPNGFNSGNLVYSTIGNANQNSYELFRTFSLSDIDKEKVWHDISINGYPFVSQCTYADYNNRINFNIVNCNLFDKYYIIANYLMENMFKISPMLSQGDAINSFMEKCQKKFRVFKCDYDINHMDEIIGRNIELVREWVQPYYAPKRVVTIDVNHNINDNQQAEGYLNSNYHITHSGSNNTIIKNSLPTFTDLIPYEDALYCEQTDTKSYWEDFLSKYGAVALGNANSNAFMRYKEWDQPDYKVIQESLAFNSSDYGPEDLKLPESVSFINTIKSNDYLNKAITITKDGTTYAPSDTDKYTLGWNITVADNGDNENLKVTLTPTSNWTLNNSVDLTNGTIENVKKNISIENIPLDDKMAISYKNFHGTEETLNNMYPIYRDGRWFNNFPVSQGFVQWHTYGRPGQGIEGAVIDGKYESVQYPHRYDSLGYNIKTKEEFRKYFKKIKYHVEANINYQIRWEGKDVEPEKTLFGSKDVELDIPQTSDKLTQTYGIEIGMNANEDQYVPLKYNVLLNKRSDEDAAQCFGGQSVTGTLSSGIIKCNAQMGTFVGVVTVTLELKDSEFVITQENQIFYNGFGNHGDWGWLGKNYGLQVERTLTETKENAYFSISRDEHLRKLEYESRVNNVVLVGNGSIESAKTRWNMNNSVNNIVFIRKDDEDYFKNKSYILTQENKKED